MNPDQIRAAMGQITADLEALENAKGDGEYTQEQIDQVNALSEKFDALDKQLEAAEKIENMKAKTAASNGRKVAAVNPNPARVDVGIDRATERFGGFKSSGEFFMAVKEAANGNVHKVFASPAYEKNGDDGGFLVPADVQEGIVTKLESKESLLASTTPLKCSGNSLTINVDEAQPWNNGVQAYWMAEGGPFTGTKPNFKQVEFKLKKLGALVVCTDELLDDAVALESYLKMAAPNAITHKINGAIVNGNGVGKMNGILGSGFTYQVSKESGQAADTVVAKNIIKMFARLLPQARAGAAWHMNSGVEEQLLGMKDDNGNFIYLAPGSQMNQSPYGLLLGRPVYPMMSAMPALGDAGDILLANLSYYYSMQKSNGGIKQAQSIHLYFDTEKTAFRFSMRIDGRVPFTAPVTTEFGDYQQSAFVKLEDR